MNHVIDACYVRHAFPKGEEMGFYYDISIAYCSFAARASQQWAADIIQFYKCFIIQDLILFLSPYA